MSTIDAKDCWTNHSAFQSGHSSSLIRYGLVLFEKKCFANIMEKEKMLWTRRIEGSKALIEDLADLKRVLPKAFIT